MTQPTYGSMIEFILNTVGFLIQEPEINSATFAQRIRTIYDNPKAKNIAAYVNALQGRWRRESLGVSYTRGAIPDLEPRPLTLDPGLDDRTLDGPTCDGYCTYGQWLRIVEIVEDWRYLVIKAGGMARKSDQDAWIVDRYPFLTEGDAHNISNHIEMRNRRLYNRRGNELVWALARPEPQYNWYDLDADNVPGKRNV